MINSITSLISEDIAHPSQFATDFLIDNTPESIIADDSLESKTPLSPVYTPSSPTYTPSSPTYTPSSPTTNTGWDSYDPGSEVTPWD